MVTYNRFNDLPDINKRLNVNDLFSIKNILKLINKVYFYQYQLTKSCIKATTSQKQKL